MRRFKLILAASLLAGSGCSQGPVVPEDALVVVETNHTTYAVGDTVVVKIKNVSGRTLDHGGCGLTLDRWIPGVHVWRKEAGPIGCAGTGQTLRHGKSATRKTALPSWARSGLYRAVAYDFAEYDPSTDPPTITPAPAISNEFTVTR